MSAVVCGSKRSFFEELPPSPPIAKRLRCSTSTSPIRFAVPSHIDHLQHLFPQMDRQLLVRALEECGNDLDAAIRSLSDLCLGSAVENPVASAEPETNLDQEFSGSIANDEEAAASENSSSSVSLDGRKWIDLFVVEMMNATTVADAKTRAARALEALENSITARASVDAAQNFHKENMQLKEQIEVLLRENTILKRAVAIQHERQKEFEDKNLELQHLKQLVAQYQEQLRTLEINNYALTMHLKQAQQSSSIPGRFHPDVF